MFQNKKIMFVVAHPDDEVLGCGGFINRLVMNESSSVKVVILGEGLTARDATRDDKARSSDLSEHRECIKQAQARLGYHHLSIHQLPDNRFDGVELLDIVKIVENEKDSFSPDYVFTHHGGDLNVDHRISFQACLTACRPMAGENVSGLFTFKTPSASEWSFDLDSAGFRPNLFIELQEKEIKAKLDAMSFYKFEVREFPHPRSLKALRSLGESEAARVGFNFVETFQTIWLKLKNQRGTNG